MYVLCMYVSAWAFLIGFYSYSLFENAESKS